MPDNFTIAPGLSIGTLTVNLGSVDAPLSLMGDTTQAFELETGGVGDQFSVIGELLLNDSILSLTGDPDLNVWYTIITASNIVGTFGVVDPNFDIAYTDTQVSVMLIPEPASYAALVGLFICGLLLWRRKKSLISNG